MDNKKIWVNKEAKDDLEVVITYLLSNHVDNLTIISS